MRRAYFAELVLLLVSGREQAGPIVGDLIEETGGGRFWWFWISITRIAAARVWRQIAEAPVRFAFFAIRAAWVELGVLFLACLALAAIMCAWLGTFHVPFPDRVLEWPARGLTTLVVPFQVGRWMARRYPGREACGCVALSSLHAFVNLAAGLLFWEIARNGGTGDVTISFTPIDFISWNGNLPATLSHVALYVSLYPVVVLAGAAFGSSKRLTPAAA
ncbi:MAG TPA: hypothetical protein VKU19_11985 [Bryobacteraceae bacterium]|nr:hypothetical protein [Bryobacteraceae bacterium]